MQNADALASTWSQVSGQSPWGLAFDREGHAFWSTNANRILRFDGKTNVEWAGNGGGLTTPVGQSIGPDGLIYATNLMGANVTVWNAD
ncbi:MAG: hypothetical protein WCO86_19865, partial [Planctomycetota bacterium]